MATNPTITRPKKGWKPSQAYPEPKIEAYIQYRVTGNSQVLSYALAFEDEKLNAMVRGNAPRTVHYGQMSRKASDMDKDACVKKRVEYLKKRNAEKMDKEGYLSLKDHRDILAEKIEELRGEGGSAAQLAKLLELDAKLAGHYIEKKETKVQINELENVLNSILDN